MRHKLNALVSVETLDRFAEKFPTGRALNVAGRGLNDQFARRHAEADADPLKGGDAVFKGFIHAASSPAASRESIA